MTARATLTLPADHTQPGTRIDDFTIAYLIAHGMSADVFAVWHHSLRAPLICKRLRATDEHDTKWRRLLRDEGAALARLKHPGIVRLIHQQQHATLPYLLLEHVGGKTLRDLLIEQQHLSTDYAMRIIQHVGGALAYTHEAGFLHRDLKPSNIILRDGRPVLLDFGVVWKWKSARRPPDRSGTPQYLAPEQIMRAPLTPATDVYGLGLLLFELLTGARPFLAGADRHDQQLTLAERYPQLTDEPPTLRSTGRRVSTKLEAIIARCLARNPRERFQNVGELLTALDSFTRIKVWPRDVMQLSEDFSPFE
jgi:serine/threonine-protein kinase